MHFKNTLLISTLASSIVFAASSLANEYPDESYPDLQMQNQPYQDYSSQENYPSSTPPNNFEEHMENP